MTRVGVDRVLEYAFEIARSRPARHLTSATKSNGISISMPYWDERVAEVGARYPDVRRDQFHIDILAANFVLKPDHFDVVVGIAPSGNINPPREFPSLFEPVHGSAPDIAGRGIANPVGQIWSAAMMLDHLGHPEAGAAVVSAIEGVLALGPTGAPLTPDMGGTATTTELGAAIAERVSSEV